MKKIVCLAALLLGVSAFAGNLSYESGMIRAHTEVFGDSTIDPVFKKATSHLSIEDSPLSLRGSVEASLSDFISDNAKRDEHMQETLESSTYPKAVFAIEEVVAKGEHAYVLKGTMSLHGQKKPMAFDATIVPEGNKVRLHATGGMKMSDFGVKPPKMVFVTVRDQVDLSIDLVLKR